MSTEFIFFQRKINSELASISPEEIEDLQGEPVIFGEYRTALEETEQDFYEEIVSFDDAERIFTEVRVP